jgi:MFS family permease
LQSPGGVDARAGDTLLRHWRVILLAGGAFVANNTCFYVAITYSVAYGSTSVGLPRETLLGAVLLASVVMIPALIACGALSDRYGRRGLFMAGALLSGAWAFAVFPLIETGSVIALNIAIVVQMVFVAMMYGPQAALFAELFPAHVRCTGASLGYQIGSVAGGGLAPLVASALMAFYGRNLAVAMYLAAMCALSFVCIVVLGRGQRAHIAD